MSKLKLLLAIAIGYFVYTRAGRQQVRSVADRAPAAAHAVRQAASTMTRTYLGKAPKAVEPIRSPE